MKFYALFLSFILTGMLQAQPCHFEKDETDANGVVIRHSDMNSLARADDHAVSVQFQQKAGEMHLVVLLNILSLDEERIPVIRKDQKVIFKLADNSILRFPVEKAVRGEKTVQESMKEDGQGLNVKRLKLAVRTPLTTEQSTQLLNSAVIKLQLKYFTNNEPTIVSLDPRPRGQEALQAALKCMSN